MNVNPNSFDVRVVRKFQKQLHLTDKDIEKELKNLNEESEKTYTWVTGETLEASDPSDSHSAASHQS